MEYTRLKAYRIVVRKFYGKQVHRKPGSRQIDNNLNWH
jgi:hypothetical protein